MQTKNQLLIAIALTAILFGGGGYLWGKKSSSATTAGLERGNLAFRGGQMGESSGNRGMRTSVNGVMGEVLSKDAQSITIALRDGGSRIVFYSPSTGVMRTATGSVTDIAIGGQVFITGTQNSDGSMTAESIQLRPESPNRTVGTGQ